MFVTNTGPGRKNITHNILYKQIITFKKPDTRHLFVQLCMTDGVYTSDIFNSW